MSTKDLHIFHVATDYIVAEDAESAKKFYLEMIGDNDPAFAEEVDGEVEEVPEVRWDCMTIVDIDEPGHPEQTFRQAFNEVLMRKSQEFPCTITSSEY